MYSYSNSSEVGKRRVNRLWEALCSGQRDALDELFRLYYSPLFDYGIRLINEEETVKDGIQDLFLRLWKRHDSLSQAQSVEAYLLSSIRRILMRQISHSQKRFEHNSAYMEKIFSESFSVEDVIIREEFQNEQKEELLKAVNHLNSRQKETLFLRYYHGLTNTEIAGVMNIAPQSVRNHLTRAISNLRLLVQPAG